MDLRLKPVKALSNLLVLSAGVIYFRDAMRQFFHFALHRMNLSEDRKAFGEDGASGEGKSVLGQVANLNSSLPRGGPVI
jgi:hypothetical protein